MLGDDPLLYSLSVNDDEADEAEEQADALEAVGALHETVALMRHEMYAIVSIAIVSIARVSIAIVSIDGGPHA